MSLSSRHLIALILLSGLPACSDTITTKDNLSINGTIVALANDVVTLKAQFPSEVKILPIKMQNVQSIEFNLLTNNPGAPPKILGFGPPAQGTPQSQAAIAADVIVLRGGIRQPCKLVRIDADYVHCNPNDSQFSRGVVLRIVLGPR